MTTSHRALAILAVAAVTLTGCGTDATPSTDSTSAAVTATASSATQGLTVADPWVKATQEKTTAAFGTLTNATDVEIHIVAASTTASDLTELHEVVTEQGESMMRQKQDGFRVPAGGTLELMPGGDHVMIMNLTKPVTAGDEVTVTLTAEDGQTYTFTGLAKPFTGANESYHSSDGTSTPSESMNDGSADN